MFDVRARTFAIFSIERFVRDIDDVKISEPVYDMIVWTFEYIGIYLYTSNTSFAHGCEFSLVKTLRRVRAYVQSSLKSYCNTNKS